jgi:hypothetical protein
VKRLLVPALLIAVGSLAAPANPADSEGVTLRVAAPHTDFRIGEQLVSRYHYNTDTLAAPVAKPFLWPVNGPGGVPLTRAWPMEKGTPGGSRDHPHQKSAWFCHGDVIPEGIELRHHVKDVAGVDFWSEGPGHGRIICTHLKPERDRLMTHNEWRTADGQKVLDEVRRIRLHDFGDTRLFVFDIDLEASVAPLTFGDTKEGSFGIRINDAIREEKGKGRLENADGKVGEANCWGHLSAWCDYSGPIDGKVVGLAILDDPSNPYPACWHARGYGLMAANPFGREKSGFPAMRGRHDLVHVAKGEHLKFRYGLLLHPGDAKEGRVAEYFKRFVSLREPGGAPSSTSQR